MFLYSIKVFREMYKFKKRKKILAQLKLNCRCVLSNPDRQKFGEKKKKKKKTKTALTHWLGVGMQKVTGVILKKNISYQ